MRAWYEVKTKCYQQESLSWETVSRLFPFKASQFVARCFCSSLCFVTVQVFRSWFTEASTKTNCYKSKQLDQDRKIKHFYGFSLLFGCHNISSLSSSDSFYRQQSKIVFEVWQVMFFLRCWFPSSKFTVHLSDNLFWVRAKGKAFGSSGKKEHLESRDILFVHCPNTLDVSIGRAYDILRERIQCLCSNIMDHLFVATSKPINDR